MIIRSLYWVVLRREIAVNQICKVIYYAQLIKYMHMGKTDAKVFCTSRQGWRLREAGEAGLQPTRRGTLASRRGKIDNSSGRFVKKNRSFND